MSNKQPQSTPASPSFEDALVRLTEIVKELEDGQVTLDESLEKYEEGVKLVSHCHGQLERAERKIELLTGVDAKGMPVTEVFDEADCSDLDEKAASRGRRRSYSDAGRTPPKRGPLPADGLDMDEDNSLF